MPTIRVVVRFRPINSREKDTALQNNWSGKEICPIYVDEKHLLQFEGEHIKEEDKVGKQVRCAPPKILQSMQPKFAFDEILVWVNQETAFSRIGHPVVTDALNGINGTIFAYGQTGSGKTFSMFGPEPLTESNSKLLGIIPRCCAQIFHNLNSDPTVKHYRIDVSFFEIYIHNTIRDLLHPAKKGDPPLKVRDGLKGVFIEHLIPETATNLQEILSLIALANSHRTTSSTKMNATSSRSHSVMRVQIRIERKDGSRVKSQINFGDLAGSEKVNKTGATGQTLREAQAINQSLTMLGNVISALAKIGSGKKKAGSMVPFRDSALTHVLKDSLSGNCKTTLVTAASPHKFNLLETISTFRFGSRCKLVKTKAEKNVVLSPAQMKKLIADLKTQIKELKMQLLKGGGTGAGNALHGIGVKITWPSDYQSWTTDKKVYNVLTKQVNKQIKNVLQTSVATNSDDVDNMPYAISLSEPGNKRKVFIQFRCDDDDEDGDYDRETCIKLSKKLAIEIDKINKNSLQPALRNYKECAAFSTPAVSQLNQVIESQKLQITLLSEQCSASQQEVMEKNKEIDDLQESVENLENKRSRSEMFGSTTFPAHTVNQTGNTSIVNIADLFGNKSNLRASSIFDGSVASNSLRITDLLSQLLHSKYQVLRSKRSLQLLQFRYDTEQKKMSQLRYIISRMQSEFLDLKATSLVSKAVLSGVNVTDDNGHGIQISKQFSMGSIYMNDDDFGFIEGALDDIMNDMDDTSIERRRSGSRKGSITATPGLIRKLSNLNDSASTNTPRGRSRAGTYHRNARSGRQQRRASASVTKTALDAYKFGKTKNNLPNQIFGDNKSAKEFGKATAKYLRKTSRKELLNDMISAATPYVLDDDDDEYDEVKEYVPNVAFDDTDKLWKGYDKEWINKWSKEDVGKWLKKIYDGRMRKYVKNFKNSKIDGKRLLDLQMPDLLDLNLIRAEALQILEFTNSIAHTLSSDDDDFGDFFNDLDDFDEFFDNDDIDDFFADDDILKRPTSIWSEDLDEEIILIPQGGDARFYDDPTLRLTDLMIEQLIASELLEIKKLRLFETKDNMECTNFNRIKEYYHDDDQVLLLTLYGLLCNKIGLLNIYEWNDLLGAVKNKTDKELQKKTDYSPSSTYFDDHMVIVNSFVDVYPIYSEYSDHETGQLTSDGGKYFVASLRQTAEHADDLRDDEDGVEFFAGLRINEMEQFVTKLPNKLWSLINNPLEIEFVYREIRRKCSQNITPQRLDRCIAEIGAKFVTPNMVQQSIKETNLSPNPTISLDIWIKKLFIKRYDEENTNHASESVLHELIILNEAFEMKYYKEHRLELMARDSLQSDYEKNNENEEHIKKYRRSNRSSVRKLIDHGSGSANYYSSDEEEKEVSWVPNYLDLHTLLHDVGRFGTSGLCQGFVKLPTSRFTVSSVLHKKKSNVERCRLNSKHGWTANYKNKDQIHWIQADLGKITTCFAVAIQGGKDIEEWITKGVLTSSLKGDDEWKKVQLTGDSNSKVGCKDSNTVQVYMFARWIKARYIRLNVYKYHKAPSLRWDLLFGDLKIDNIT